MDFQLVVCSAPARRGDIAARCPYLFQFSDLTNRHFAGGLCRQTGLP
jgi:hypothetical protein